jgi:hypothetical protein
MGRETGVGQHHLAGRMTSWPSTKARRVLAALKRIGWVGDEKVGARKMHAYFEYHIEQGPMLRAREVCNIHTLQYLVAGIELDRMKK